MEENLFNLLNQRRSVRSFTDEQVKKDDLIKIATAARTAPTALNTQSRKFTIVQNKTLIQKLAKAIGQAHGNPDYNLYNPNALLLISSPKDYESGQVEIGLAAMNAYLAVTALGLGTVWTNQIRNICDHENVRRVLSEIGLPTSHVCYCVLPIGVPADTPVVKERTEDISYVE